jgi:hypothetical protein
LASTSRALRAGALGALAWASVASAGAAPQACADGAASLPASRFQDNGDGTVTDVQHKLVWMRCPSGQRWVSPRCVGTATAFDWRDAKRHADEVSRDGAAFFNDWRVPALRELATITDRGCSNPRTNVAVFPGTPSAPFWSATPRPGEDAGERALALSFGSEGVMLARKGERFHVRLVRTGP